jgi:hypothetical protein
MAYVLDVSALAGAGAVFSDGRDDGFVVYAECAIVRPEIEAGFFRFDARQQQRPVAFGAGRPEFIDELEFGGLCHGEGEAASVGGLCYPSLTTAFFAPRRVDFVTGLHWLHYHRIAGASAGRTLRLNSIRHCFFHLNLSGLTWRPLSF